MSWIMVLAVGAWGLYFIVVLSAVVVIAMVSMVGVSMRSWNTAAPRGLRYDVPAQRRSSCRIFINIVYSIWVGVFCN
jgi:hypothetical protein